jgi:hypothetical protein
VEPTVPRKIDYKFSFFIKIYKTTYNVMMAHKISPMMSAREMTIKRYSKSKPYLNWDKSNRNGILRSGWNPLRGINICFNDESQTNNRMSIIIELNAPMYHTGLSKMHPTHVPFVTKEFNHKIVAFGYFFEQDRNSKEINLILRIKPFYEKEYIILYRDCNYFGICYENIALDSKHIFESKFVISNDWQDKAIKTVINFYHKSFRDFHYVVEAVNDFIQNNKMKEHMIPEFARAFPMLNVVKCRWNFIDNESYSHNQERISRCGICQYDEMSVYNQAVVEPICVYFANAEIVDNIEDDCVVINA